MPSPQRIESITSSDVLRVRARAAVDRCGGELGAPDGAQLMARSPITGDDLLPCPRASDAEVAAAVTRADTAFKRWRTVPAPIRGGVVKRFGALLEENKEALADLVTIEVGKIPSEALGEVQEMIDVCDFAVGLSRQLDGRTMPSERPAHRLMETWHPLGVVGVITAFNFPVAVWSWNAAVALVCGDTLVWKPSPLTPLTAIACDALLARAAREQGAPADLNVTVLADAEAGQTLVDHPDVPLVSATGSEQMGAQVGKRVAARLGRSLLELGGNNAAIVTASADLDLAAEAILFAAAGSAGQRCTTLRRLIVAEPVVEELSSRLARDFRGLRVGDPYGEATVVGPLIDGAARERMERALERAESEGGERVGGAWVPAAGYPDAHYVEPALVRMPAQTDLVRTETFAPILYVMAYGELETAIAMHNDVPQGLSSSIFTTDQREAERFLAADGSDCGLVNVNLGTSGAEIGGAFGGEKSTGGGRESGSDAWRAYMRRATNTINYSDRLALAQGVRFG